MKSASRITAACAHIRLGKLKSVCTLMNLGLVIQSKARSFGGKKDVDVLSSALAGLLHRCILILLGTHLKKINKIARFCVIIQFFSLVPDVRAAVNRRSQCAAPSREWRFMLTSGSWSTERHEYRPQRHASHPSTAASSVFASADFTRLRPYTG